MSVQSAPEYQGEGGSSASKFSCYKRVGYGDDQGSTIEYSSECSQSGEVDLLCRARSTMVYSVLQ